jgi:arylsulfatase A-like enzyme
MSERRLPTVLLLGLVLLLSAAGLGIASPEEAGEPLRPNVVLIMTDDQGWGETGYAGHPVLRTPNLDAMAASGLRFDRFYAASPVCSPTRASVLTGRSPDRTGVRGHGRALRLQERSLASALRDAGYATALFGKWHLNGVRGPGVPILPDDEHGPGAFGFERWLAATNYFDLDPLLSRNGAFESFRGDSSDVIVREALRFMATSVEAGRPFLAVIWDGSPHDPWVASAADRAPFASLDEPSQHHYGELVAFDRALGELREGLRELGVEKDTILWFCSDNGGLDGIEPGTVGGLRGRKGRLWEGGIRVPAVLEWPGRIEPRVTSRPASTMDVFPTLVDLLGLPESVLLEPVDGISLVPALGGEAGPRERPIPFRHKGGGALVDGDWKLVAPSVDERRYELYDLAGDPAESTDVAKENPEVLARLVGAFEAWNESVEKSVRGEDYEGGLAAPDGEPIYWNVDPRYAPYLDEWKRRPEYRELLTSRLDRLFGSLWGLAGVLVLLAAVVATVLRLRRRRA